MTTMTDPETVAANERLVEEFLTAFVGGDGDVIDGLVTDECVLHQPRWPLDTAGREALVEKTGEMAGTFTDVRLTVDRSVVDGDRIAVQATASGRNVGPMRLE